MNNIIKQKWTMLLLLITLISSSKTWAQQDKMFSQYMFNMMALNPAYAGSRDVLSATALYRNQWGGMAGAPQTATFSIDMPVNRERVGLGLQLFNDQVGLENWTGAMLSYAFRIKLGERSTLALGLQGGAMSFRWDLSKANLGNNLTDPAFANNVSKILPNFGTGIYLSNDRSYIGVSVPYLIENNLSDYDSGDNRAKVRRHFYVISGFVIGRNNIKLKPSMMARYVQGTGLSLDGNLNLWFNDRIAVGMSYRHNRFSTYAGKIQEDISGKVLSGDALVGMLELQLSDQFRLGYSYDWTRNRLNQERKFLSIPTHEIMLRYEFGFSKSKILTPRYF
ncbi:type IX secretion system membrane protein PorP/SprF [Runella sp. CRIBMP]|jgi:type IX secretion system PorP/SprF family membrane protein|uniref:PorP/SprF family type IX secretion system membrane protein n=1 Tax=Runella sp. CRIBMP TaxID=2683261 RepID=UPI0014128370|nr:type IX secretion system membrane protein PorP/SprF [Runella sp. CRIBMP]NBB21180.1 type IX secretion system membrane protein PorP/SprF [Runella sp. CRIBMP]